MNNPLENKLLIELKKLDIENQKTIYLNLANSETPFEDLVKMLYQIRIAAIENDDPIEFERVMFNDIMQVAMAMHNVVRYYKQKPELIETYKKSLRFIVQYATLCVDLANKERESNLFKGNDENKI